MTICKSCGIAYLDGEAHTCRGEPTGAALYFGAGRSLHVSLMMFGAVAGVIWAIVPWVLVDMIHPVGQAATVFVAGAITGVVMSQLLAIPLAGRGRPGTLLLGILSYPVAAFVFGVLISIVQWVVKATFGVTYRAMSDGFAPIESGVGLAVRATFWPFALVLVPLAMWTTHQLKTIIDMKAAKSALPNKRMQPSTPICEGRRG
jgi:hypothetical protein